jgi:TatA/E family protein of Tat protein translocase
MIANLMGGDGLIVIVVALVVLVGGSQLPKIARNVGLAGKEFRKAQSEAEDEAAREKAASAAATVPPAVALPASPAPAPAPTPTPAPATAAAGPAPAAGEPSITLTPAQLDALLKAREEQTRNDPASNERQLEVQSRTDRVRPRRWRAMRRRSRSDEPPQTPCSIRLYRAYSRQGALTGQSAQMRRAISTPTPSLGKKVSGGNSRHLPSAIQFVSTVSRSSVNPSTLKVSRW